MNDLEIFKNEEFGEIRTVEVKGKPYFVASDVAKALGYAKPQNAVSQHCKGALKQGIGVITGRKADGTPTSQVVDMLIIPEGDLYRLITHSKLESAEKFESWVFDDVLPSIRKHGVYVVDELLENPDIAIKAFTALKAEREKNKALQEENKRMKPKEIFANAVSASNTSILIGELAKILKQNGVNIGQNRLFEWMRQNGYLINRKGIDYNMPTQKSMERELLEIKERTINNPDGTVRITKTVLVTGKGQQYFINKFLM